MPIPNLPAITAPDQKRTAGAAWVLVGFLAAVVLSLGWFGRESIVVAWPPAEAIYASLGISAFPAPGAGFSVEMEVKRDAETLRLIGEVVNDTDESRAIPPIFAVLQDAGGKALRHWQLSVDAATLGPGERVPFSTEIDSMPEGTANISVLFTNPADNQ